MESCWENSHAQETSRKQNLFRFVLPPMLIPYKYNKDTIIIPYFMVLLWYYNGNIMVLLWYYHRVYLGGTGEEHRRIIGGRTNLKHEKSPSFSNKGKISKV